MLINISTFRIRATQRAGEKHENTCAALRIPTDSNVDAFELSRCNYPQNLSKNIDFILFIRDIHMILSLYVN